MIVNTRQGIRCVLKVSCGPTRPQDDVFVLACLCNCYVVITALATTAEAIFQRFWSAQRVLVVNS